MTTIANKDALLTSHLRTFNWRNLKRIDWILFVLTLALCAIGIATLYSASLSAATDVPYYVKQSIFLFAGLLLAGLIICTDYRALLSLAPVMYGGIVLLLILVLIIGHTAMGGRHWLRYGGVGLQPSEFSKLALVFMLSWYLARVQGKIQRLPYLFVAFGIMGLMLLLILLEADLGTAVIMSPIVFGMVFAAGCKRRHLIGIVLIGVISIPIAYWNLDRLPLQPHQKQRIISFLDPKEEPEFALKAGYQITQTVIAVGSGQMWGKGFGKGTQTQMHFLPEYQTDFVFALLAEEWGFVGSAITIGLYALFLLRSLSLARSCPDLAGSLLVVGCMTIIGLHVFVNIAITVRLLPVTGLPLPFLSYGGSFLLTTLMCVGTILSVNVRRNFFD